MMIEEMRREGFFGIRSSLLSTELSAPGLGQKKARAFSGDSREEPYMAFLRCIYRKG